MRPIFTPNQLNEKYILPLYAYLTRLLWGPIKFLAIGLSEIQKSVITWIFMTSILFPFGLWVVKDSGVSNTQVINIVLLSALAIPPFLLTFALPSNYCQSDVTQANVDFVIRHLQERGFANVRKIELLKKNIKLYSDRIRSRLIVLKGIVAFLYTACTYFIVKIFENKTGTLMSLFYGILDLSPFIIFVFLLYVIVWSYNAASGKLFHAIEFGCNDLCDLIPSTPEK
jgi:hypothetical protein